MIPRNCRSCSRSNTPEFYDYGRLLRRQEKGRKTIECDESFQAVNIQEILDGVYEAVTC